MLTSIPITAIKNMSSTRVNPSGFLGLILSRFRVGTQKHELLTQRRTLSTMKNLSPLLIHAPLALAIFVPQS